MFQLRVRGRDCSGENLETEILAEICRNPADVGARLVVFEVKLKMIQQILLWKQKENQIPKLILDGEVYRQDAINIIKNNSKISRMDINPGY